MKEERELILVVSPLSHTCHFFLEKKWHLWSITVISKPTKQSPAATESPDKDK